MMSFFRWTEGRQGTGYFKMKLLESSLLRLDVYLIKFPEGSKINWHTDPVPEGYAHHRLNITLKKAEVGGSTIFRDDSGITADNSSFVRFRPDLDEHRITRVSSGTKLILSIGRMVKEQ